MPQLPSIEIDGALVAGELDLDVAVFRELMADKRVSVLCERGTEEDEGLLRVSFYLGKRRARFVLQQDERLGWSLRDIEPRSAD